MSAGEISMKRVSPGAGTKTKRMVDPRRFLSTAMPRLRLRVESPLVVDRQAKPREQTARAVGQRGRADAQHGAEIQRRDHAERHRLAVQQAVTRRRLQRVPDGVAEVQDRAPARSRARPTATTSAFTRTARA